VIIVVQIGYAQSYKETQRVNAFLNNEKLSWLKVDNEYDGKFVTPLSKRQNLIWFLKRCICSPGDILRLETSVFIKGAGLDEERTRTVEFMVQDDAPLFDFEINKVGDRNFPLLSGKLILLQSRTVFENRIEAGECLIREAHDPVE